MMRMLFYPNIDYDQFLFFLSLSSGSPKNALEKNWPCRMSEILHGYFSTHTVVSLHPRWTKEGLSALNLILNGFCSMSSFPSTPG